MNDPVSVFDINAWYIAHEICPRCGMNLRTCDPQTNLFPHFMGGCVAPVSDSDEPNILERS